MITWDAASGQALRWLETPGANHIHVVAYSPDSRRVAAAASATVWVWDAATGRPEIQLAPKFADSSPASGQSPTAATKLNISSDKSTPMFASTLAFSPDSKFLAIGYADGSISVRNAQSGGASILMHGHTGTITGIAFSPAGGRIASASEDGTVRQWETVAGQEVLILKPSKRKLTSLAVSHDGGRLIAGSQSGAVLLWNGTRGESGVLPDR